MPKINIETEEAYDASDVAQALSNVRAIRQDLLTVKQIMVFFCWVQVIGLILVGVVGIMAAVDLHKISNPSAASTSTSSTHCVETTFGPVCY